MKLVTMPPRHGGKAEPGPKLLMVEGDLSSLEALYEVLTSFAQVYVARESEQLLDLIKNERFDGIFVDLQMPNIDGLALTQLIRKSSTNRTTPIFVVTGKDDKDARQKVWCEGATFVLSNHKPIDRRRIRSLVNSVRAMTLNHHGYFVA